MSKKPGLNNIIIVALFAVFIAGFCLVQALLPDESISAAERRRLAQKPVFSVESLLSGKYMSDTEKYLADQFPLRQELRTVKAAWHFNAFRQKDNDGIYIAGGSVCKLAKDMDTAQVDALIKKINSVYGTYLDGMKVYFAAIPDKSRFAAAEYGYPSLDYAALDARLKAGLAGGIQYMGFDPCRELGLDDYYKTDIHWRQERLQSVVDSLGSAMGFAPAKLDLYSQKEYAPFYGGYCGQSALDVGSDTIRCLSSAVTDGAVVTGLDFKGEKQVYEKADFEKLDGYDVFLGGPQTIVTVENPSGKTGKELYIFRDSFASSLTPLLLESYDKITLIDLRYVAADLVGQFVDFAPGADVLFLYSTEIINSGMLLK